MKTHSDFKENRIEEFIYKGKHAKIVFPDKINIVCKVALRFVKCFLTLYIKINQFIATTISHHLINDI